MKSPFLLFLLAAVVLLLQQTASSTIIVGSGYPRFKVPILCARNRAPAYSYENEERTVTPCAQLNDMYKSYYIQRPIPSVKELPGDPIDQQKRGEEGMEGEEQITLVPGAAAANAMAKEEEEKKKKREAEKGQEQGYRFLIADPKLQNKIFDKTVIILFGEKFESTESWGNAGLVLNKPLGVYVSDIFVTFFGEKVLPKHLENEVVYNGGPAQKEMYNVIVSIDKNNPVTDGMDKSQWGLIGKNLYVMGVGPFRELVKRNTTYYEKTGKSLTTFWRMFSGYTVWARGQLAIELTIPNGWIEYRTLSFPVGVLERLDKYKLYWHMIKLSENKKQN